MHSSKFSNGIDEFILVLFVLYCNYYCIVTSSSVNWRAFMNWMISRWIMSLLLSDNEMSVNFHTLYKKFLIHICRTKTIYLPRWTVVKIQWKIYSKLSVQSEPYILFVIDLIGFCYRTHLVVLKTYSKLDVCRLLPVYSGEHAMPEIELMTSHM